MLPDLIDKPLGVFLFTDTFSNGRIITHALLVPLLTYGVGIALYRLKRKP